MKSEGSEFANADSVFVPWSGDPSKFIKTIVPEFPSWSFDKPDADLR